MVCLILVSLFVWLRTSASGEFAKQFSSQQKDNLVNAFNWGRAETLNPIQHVSSLISFSILFWSQFHSDLDQIETSELRVHSRLVRRGRFMSQYVTIAVKNSFIYKLIWFVSNIHMSCLCTKQHFYIHMCIFIESNFWLLFDTSLESWPWVR